MSKIPHLVQYQGSKRNLAAKILEFMPTGFHRLIEPFAGSAAITLACASSKKSQRYVLNDLNKPLITLFQMIVEEPQTAAKRYKEIWTDQQYDNIEHYYQIREKFNATGDPLLFLYLLARCVKGSVRYNAEGAFNQSPDKRRKGTTPSKMEKNIFEISTLLKGRTDYYALDYKEVLDMTAPGDIVYMDPPYQGVCGDRDSRYFCGINHHEFVDALRALVKRRIPFIVSYDGKCGEKIYGNEIPTDMGITHIQLYAGRSTQSTLLGKNEITYESLYISNDLLVKAKRLTRRNNENELFA